MTIMNARTNPNSGWSRRAASRFLIGVLLFAGATFGANAVTVNEGDVYRVDFDFSANPNPPYDQIYILLSLHDMNPGEAFRLSLYDDENTFIGSVDVTNDGTLTLPEGTHDYPLWGQSIFIPAGTHFNDSQGFWLIEGLTGSFDVVSALTEISLRNVWYSGRVEQPVKAYNIPALLSDLSHLISSADLTRGTRRSLLASLAAIRTSYQRGDSNSMLHQIDALQMKIQVRVQRENPGLAEQLAQDVQGMLLLLAP